MCKRRSPPKPGDPSSAFLPFSRAIRTPISSSPNSPLCRAKAPIPTSPKIPDGPEKLAVRAEALAASGKPDAGIALTGGDPRILFAAAMGLVEARKFEPAEQFFAAALEKAPDNFDILYNLAMAATHAGHLERAVESLPGGPQTEPG